MRQFSRSLPLAILLGLATVSAASAFGRAAPAPLFDFAAADGDKDGKLSKDEIDAWRTAQQQAMDTNVDGFVDAAEMKAEIVGKLTERAGDMAEDRIERQDGDGDGKLSMAEMEPGDRGTRMFDRIDGDGDGFITQEEFEAVRERMREHRRHDGPWFGDAPQD